MDSKGVYKEVLKRIDIVLESKYKDLNDKHCRTLVVLLLQESLSNISGTIQYLITCNEINNTPIVIDDKELRIEVQYQYQYKSVMSDTSLIRRRIRPKGLTFELVMY